MIGEILWQPPADLRQSTQIGRFMEFAERRSDQRFAGYDDLWRWSVEDLEGFWGSIWEFFELHAHAPFERVLASRQMPGAVWFPGARLNYAEHLVGRDEDTETVAVVAHSQTRPELEVTFGELREQVARARAGLQRLGVGPGDRVVAYLPNIPETLVRVHRHREPGGDLGRLRPGVRRAQRHRPFRADRAEGDAGRRRLRLPRPLCEPASEVEAISGRLPSLEHVVAVPYGEAAVPDAVAWPDLLSESAALEFQPVAFDHPLYVLFSSGTTGLPKAIVHGHGGQLWSTTRTRVWDGTSGPASGCSGSPPRRG